MPYHIKTPAKLNTGDVYWKGGNVWTNVYADRLQYANKSDADAQAATTETNVRDKPDCVYTSGKPMRHKMIHTLLLCNEECWHELVYVKHRRIREIQHYSQYDDVNQDEKIVSNVGDYKSQEGRLPDY